MLLIDPLHNYYKCEQLLCRSHKMAINSITIRLKAHLFEIELFNDII